jgi:hypothetical protein
MRANANSAHRVSAPRLRARVARDAANHARRLLTTSRARPEDANDDADERAREGDRAMDWRQFRARLIAKETSNETLAARVDAAAGEGGAAWAHGLVNAEKGAILVARDEDAASFWSHVVILLLGETRSTSRSSRVFEVVMGPRNAREAARGDSSGQTDDDSLFLFAPRRSHGVRFDGSDHQSHQVDHPVGGVSGGVEAKE